MIIWLIFEDKRRQMREQMLFSQGWLPYRQRSSKILSYFFLPKKKIKEQQKYRGNTIKIHNARETAKYFPPFCKIKNAK